MATGRRPASGAETFQVDHAGLVDGIPAATNVDVEVRAAEVLGDTGSPLDQGDGPVHGLVEVQVDQFCG